MILSKPSLQILYTSVNRYLFGELPARAGNQPKKTRSIIRIWYFMMSHSTMSNKNTGVKNNQVLPKLDHVLEKIEECNEANAEPENWSDELNPSTANYLNILDYIAVCLWRVMTMMTEAGENAGNRPDPPIIVPELFRFISSDLGLRLVENWERTCTYDDYLVAI